MVYYFPHKPIDGHRAHIHFLHVGYNYNRTQCPHSSFHESLNKFRIKILFSLLKRFMYCVQCTVVLIVSDRCSFFSQLFFGVVYDVYVFPAMQNGMILSGIYVPLKIAVYRITEQPVA